MRTGRASLAGAFFAFAVQSAAGMTVMPDPRVAAAESADALRTFAAAGIRRASAILSLDDWESPQKWWRDENDYDWALFDRQVHGVLDAVPGLTLFPRIKIDPPKAWLERHPEEACPYSPRDRIVRPESAAWRRLYRGMLKDVVDHVVRSDYADRIVGYHLGALHCGEWLVSPIADGYFPSVEWDARDPLPPLAVTAKRRAVIDAANEAVADAAVDAARTLRRLVGPDKRIGGFFGYVTFSHEKMARVFASGAYDFFAAPPHYGDSREIGHPGASQAHYLASFRLHDAVFYEETDYRTFLSNPRAAPKGMTRMRPLDESLGLIRRSIGKLLCGGYENWWFLLGGNRTFDDPKMMESIRIGAAEERRTRTSTGWTPAEVAVFTSADEYATSYETVNLDFRHDCKVRPHLEVLPLCGVPYDSYELTDIASPRLPDYRVYMFLNAFTLSEEMRAAIKARVRRAGRTAVWVYAPGYYRRGEGSVSNVCELTGMDITEAYPVDGRLASRRFAAAKSVVEKDGARSVFFPLPPSVRDCREAFRAAGAHVWLETDDVLAAGRGFVMLHAASAGEKRLRLPGRFDAKEIFGAVPERKDVAELVDGMPLGETRVYSLGR